jgi:membrane glycosyltransferase
LLSTALLAVHTLVEPQYFVSPNQLFPIWPEWHVERALTLWGATAVVLFLPKLLSILLVWVQGARDFGGRARLALGVLLESLSSMLLAPVRMLFHTEFVLTAIAGLRAQWKSPPREDAETTWGEALRRHGFHTLIGVAWAAGVYWLNPSFLLWLMPVVGALMLSIPMSVYSSRVSLGKRLRRLGMFLIPEEASAPVELRRMQELLRRAPPSPGFVEAVVDPLANALACAAGNVRQSQPAALRESALKLVEEALRVGPAALTDRQKSALLSDAPALSRLHFQVWASPQAHAAWFGREAPPAPLADRSAAPPPAPHGLTHAAAG